METIKPLPSHTPDREKEIEKGELIEISVKNSSDDGCDVIAIGDTTVKIPGADEKITKKVLSVAEKVAERVASLSKAQMMEINADLCGHDTFKCALFDNASNKEEILISTEVANYFRTYMKYQRNEDMYFGAQSEN